MDRGISASGGLSGKGEKFREARESKLFLEFSKESGKECFEG